MSTTVSRDWVGDLVDDIFERPSTVHELCEALAAIEPIVEQEYALGRTSVKPVRLMTVDDLIF